mmetsp:Transcript_25512/g.63259  ORF Transcript_25512/g.63259 Transcript_25512/m.63259 type:complete len:237 (-) Transcript_25512:32-742(-)
MRQRHEEVRREAQLRLGLVPHLRARLGDRRELRVDVGRVDRDVFSKEAAEQGRLVAHLQLVVARQALELCVVEVAVEADALEAVDLRAQLLPRQVELVVAQADEIHLRHVEALEHRLSAVDRRQDARREKVAVEGRDDDAVQLARRLARRLDRGGKARVVLERVDVVDRQDAQEGADCARRSWSDLAGQVASDVCERVGRVVLDRVPQRRREQLIHLVLGEVTLHLLLPVSHGASV